MEEADKSREDPSCQASKDKEAQVERGPWCEVRTFRSQDLQVCEWKEQDCVHVCTYMQVKQTVAPRVVSSS